jgi:hypothetical protein
LVDLMPTTSNSEAHCSTSGLVFSSGCTPSISSGRTASISLTCRSALSCGNGRDDDYQEPASADYAVVLCRAKTRLTLVGCQCPFLAGISLASEHRLWCCTQVLQSSFGESVRSPQIRQGVIHTASVLRGSLTWHEHADAHLGASVRSWHVRIRRMHPSSDEAAHELDRQKVGRAQHMRQSQTRCA